MPNAIKADWTLIQSLYLKGMTPKKISEQTGVKAGTISSRAFHGNWSKPRADASIIVQAHNSQLRQDDSLSETCGLGKQSARVRSGLAGVLEKSIERLEKLTFATPKAALRANQELESVVRNAKTVFGWSEGQSQPAVRINILSQVKPADDRPVIDVTPKEIDKGQG